MGSKSLRTEKNNKNNAQENIAVFTASMTVEAALVLPLFLFCIFNIIFLLDAVRLQSRVAAALQQTGDQICEYAWYREYAVGGLGAESDSDAGSGGSIGLPQAAGDILSLAFVSGTVRNHLGTEYMNNTCLRGGSSGISYLRSKI